MNESIKARRALQRIGEERTMCNGMRAKIIAYHSASNVDVKFADGTIRKGVSYGQFKSGNCRNPNITNTAYLMQIPSKYIDRVGETYVMNNGMKATVIAYRSAKDIDIQFEDGAIRKNVLYWQFRRKTIKHPSDSMRGAIGQVFELQSGLKVKIVAFESARAGHYRYTVDIGDNTLVEGVSYTRLKRGTLHIPPIYKNQGESTIVTYVTKELLTFKIDSNLVSLFEKYNRFSYINNRGREGIYGMLPNKRSSVSMAKVVLSQVIPAARWAKIEYKNNDPTDIRLENLQIVFKKSKASGYYGVRPIRYRGYVSKKWYIKVAGHYASFYDARKAALAFDRIVKEKYGKYVKTNFSDTE